MSLYTPQAPTKEINYYCALIKCLKTITDTKTNKTFDEFYLLSETAKDNKTAKQECKVLIQDNLYCYTMNPPNKEPLDIWIVCTNPVIRRDFAEEQYKKYSTHITTAQALEASIFQPQGS